MYFGACVVGDTRLMDAICVCFNVGSFECDIVSEYDGYVDAL